VYKIFIYFDIYYLIYIFDNSFLMFLLYMRYYAILRYIMNFIKLFKQSFLNYFNFVKGHGLSLRIIQKLSHFMVKKDLASK